MIFLPFPGGSGIFERMQSELQLALCTVPDRETADAIATALVNGRLAACVNIIPGLTSVYRWEGKTETAAELLLLIKTSGNNWQALEKTIVGMHPYELPEIITVPLAGGLPAYLDWVAGAMDNA